MLVSGPSPKDDTLLLYSEGSKELGASKSTPSSLIPPLPNLTRANRKSKSPSSAVASLSSKWVVPPRSKSMPNYNDTPSIGGVLRLLHLHWCPSPLQNSFPRVHTTRSFHRIRTSCHQRTMYMPPSPSPPTILSLYNNPIHIIPG